jgi:hypothetical protein
VPIIPMLPLPPVRSIYPPETTLDEALALFDLIITIQKKNNCDAVAPFARHWRWTELVEEYIGTTRVDLIIGMRYRHELHATICTSRLQLHPDSLRVPIVNAIINYLWNVHTGAPLDTSELRAACKRYLDVVPLIRYSITDVDKDVANSEDPLDSFSRDGAVARFISSIIHHGEFPRDVTDVQYLGAKVDTRVNWFVSAVFKPQDQRMAFVAICVLIAKHSYLPTFQDKAANLQHTLEEALRAREPPPAGARVPPIRPAPYNPTPRRSPFTAATPPAPPPANCRTARST